MENTVIDIEKEIAAHPDYIKNIERQVKAVKNTSEETFKEQHMVLENRIKETEGFTKRIIDHMFMLHNQYVSQVTERIAKEGLSKDAYSNYLVQAWYHTKHTPTFEKLFTDKFSAYVQEKESDLSNVDRGDNKFMKLMDHDIDEELGHELWALQDVLRLGTKTQIDLKTDVYPETKALVNTQYDRLTRLNFKGFLGYSFYLEMFVALTAPKLLEGFAPLIGIKPEDNAFIYNHWAVDLGHSVDNIELLDVLIENESDFNEVIENMELIHNFYLTFTLKSFEKKNVTNVVEETKKKLTGFEHMMVKDFKKRNPIVTPLMILSATMGIGFCLANAEMSLPFIILAALSGGVIGSVIEKLYVAKMQKIVFKVLENVN